MHFTVRAQCRQCGVSAAPAPAGHLLHTELGWAGERLGRGWHNETPGHPPASAPTLLDCSSHSCHCLAEINKHAAKFRNHSPPLGLRPKGNEVYCNNLILLKCTVCIIQQALPRAWSIYLRWKILKSRDAKGLKCYVCFCDGLYWSTTLWSIIVLSPHKEGINYKCCRYAARTRTNKMSYFSFISTENL